MQHYATEDVRKALSAMPRLPKAGPSAARTLHSRACARLEGSAAVCHAVVVHAAVLFTPP